MRTLLCIITIGMAAAGWTDGHAYAREGCPYAYSDDYSTNKVEADSYSHSPIEHAFCLSCWSGWLMFIADSTGNRGLGFYPGQAFGSLPASVGYAFPPDSAAGGMTGRLEFDMFEAVAANGSWGFGSGQVLVYYDGLQVGRIPVTSPGHYTFDLAPPLGVEKVYFWFMGQMIRLDDLGICLDNLMPARSPSWGQLKAIYR